jgi:hypothetical protein
MNRSGEIRLKDLLSRQTKAVSDKAIQDNGQVSADKVDALEHLAKLVQIGETAHSPSPRRRWPVVAVLVGTLLIVSILFFMRVSETEIELDVALSEVDFALHSEQVLTDVMGLAAIGVSGLREIRLPRSQDLELPTTSTTENATAAIRLSAPPEEASGTVTLATLVLPAETYVGIRPTGLSQQYRLTIEGSEFILDIAVNGAVRIEMAGSPAWQFNFSSPKPVVLQTGSYATDIDLTLQDNFPGTFSKQLLVKTLSLFRIDEFTDLDRTVVRRTSAILSGNLYMESLYGEKHMLRVGESLQFEIVRGEIRTLNLHDDRIALKFHGHVRRMSTGTGESHRSLMPTYLEWLQARHGLSLLWGTTLYLFALAGGVMRWWGIRI